MTSTHGWSKHLKKFFLLVFLLINLTLSTESMAGTKVGYVQLNIIMQSPQSLAIGAKIQAEFKPRNQELEKYHKLILDKEAQLERDAPTLSAKEYATKRQEIDYQKIDYERKRSKQHDDFVLRKQEELNNFQNSINAAVAAFAQAEGYDLILYNIGGYIGTHADVTDRVLKYIK
jgi:outer membrane protein